VGPGYPEDQAAAIGQARSFRLIQKNPACHQVSAFAFDSEKKIVMKILVVVQSGKDLSLRSR
jgi:hypothetical protein